jgi:hypothetical protein
VTEHERTMYKTCSGCKKQLRLYNFYKSEHEADGYYRWCVGCVKAEGKKPERQRQRLLLARARRLARATGCACTLEAVDIPLPRVCEYACLPLDYNLGRGVPSANAATVDRVDYTRAFTPGNIQVVSRLYYDLRQQLSLHKLTALAAAILANQRDDYLSPQAIAAHNRRRSIEER